eukprot:GGOE01054539.1.p1 GENE.GGOE01054539.1~~GGOE01054539.1.p1  ORF type:complete len:618 (-),score=158.79 GGOE01054539.1:645-2447(-)
MEKYDIFRKVGEGSFGEVLQCRNRHTSEIVAIKKFKTSDTDEATKELNEREIKILQELRGHPGIVELKEVFLDNTYQCLVFEFLSCDLLGRFEACRSGFPEEQVLMYTRQLVQAVHDCHSIDVAHRDIKPENLLLNADFTVMKLCDFGCARKMHTRMKLTEYVATRWYRAPELHLGTSGYDFAVDVWGVGCIMAEMVEGRPLFPCKDDLDGIGMIHRCLGLTEEMVELIKTHPVARWRGLALPPVEKDFLQNRFKGRLSPAGIDFLQRLLKTDPKERMSMAQALEHEYLCPEKPREKERSKPKKKRKDSGSKAEKADKVDKVEKADKAMRAERADKGERVEKVEKAAKKEKKRREKRLEKRAMREADEYESDFENDINSPLYTTNRDFEHTVNRDFEHTIKPPMVDSPTADCRYEDDFYEFASSEAAETPKFPPKQQGLAKLNVRKDAGMPAAALPLLSNQKAHEAKLGPLAPLPSKVPAMTPSSHAERGTKSKVKALPSPAVPVPKKHREAMRIEAIPFHAGPLFPQSSPLRHSPLAPIDPFERTLRHKVTNPQSAPVAPTRPKVALQHVPPMTVSGVVAGPTNLRRGLPELPIGHKAC